VVRCGVNETVLTDNDILLMVKAESGEDSIIAEHAEPNAAGKGVQYQKEDFVGQLERT
jgi:hypothetical protein